MLKSRNKDLILKKLLEKRVLSLTELSVSTELSIEEIHQALSELITNGYVDLIGGDIYKLLEKGELFIKAGNLFENEFSRVQSEKDFEKNLKIKTIKINAWSIRIAALGVIISSCISGIAIWVNNKESSITREKLKDLSIKVERLKNIKPIVNDSINTLNIQNTNADTMYNQRGAVISIIK